MSLVSLVTSLDLDGLGRVGAALADPTRRRVLAALLAGPAYPGRLAEGMGTTRANMSNHLACLRGCGLVRATREGRQVRYELADARLARALHELAQLPPVAGDCPDHPAPRQ